MKLKVRGESKPEPTVELWLVQGANGEVSLKGKRVEGITAFYLATISEEGIRLSRNIGSDLGLELNKDGQLIVL